MSPAMTVTGSAEGTYPAQHALRHLVATLAYRASKVLRDAPADFATFSFSDVTRTPVKIVAHMGDLMAWGGNLAAGSYTWRAEGGDDWDTEVRRFFAGLEALDAKLVAAEPPEGYTEMLIQGALADALTHVGQIAMLRGVAGAPVRPESYARAEIVRGRVGAQQAASRKEFDGDASVPREKQGKG